MELFEEVTWKLKDYTYFIDTLTQLHYDVLCDDIKMSELKRDFLIECLMLVNGEIDDFGTWQYRKIKDSDKFKELLKEFVSMDKDHPAARDLKLTMIALKRQRKSLEA